MAEKPIIDLTLLTKRWEFWSLDQIDEVIIRKQQRLTFDEAELSELAYTIRSAGMVLSPLVVAWRDEVGYLLIAGERRVRALKQLRASGWEPTEKTPVRIYVNPSELEIAMLQAIENSHRRPPPHEEAEHMASSFERARAFLPGVQQSWFARQMGRGPSTLRAARRYAQLPEEIKQLVRDGNLAYMGAVHFARLLEHLNEGEIYQRALNTAAEKGSVGDAKRSVQSFFDHLESGQTSLVPDEEEVSSHRQKRRSLIASRMIASVHQGLEYLRRIEQLQESGLLEDGDLPFQNRSVVETYLKFVRVLEAQLPAFQAAKGELAARRVQHVLTAAGESLEALDGELAIATVGD